MKKIIITLLSCMTIIGCTLDDENTNEASAIEVAIPENLIGSWKFVGIYNYFDIDQVDSPYIEYYDNGTILSFNANNTFNDTNGINNNGTFTIFSDSVLTRFYNANNSIEPFRVKIVTLNDSILDFTCTNQNNTGNFPCEAYRYKKIE